VTDPTSGPAAHDRATSAEPPSSSPSSPTKQEKEPASVEITEVAPGVLRLQLPIDLPGLGHVNTYALEDGRGFALVDPGLPGEASWQALMARLGAAGIPVRRVHTVIVTHSHPDHFGGAGLLAEETGAEVVASTWFRTFFDGRLDDDVELEARADAGAGADDLGGGDDEALDFRRPAPWGGTIEGPPPDKVALFRQSLSGGLPYFRVPKPTVRLDDADTISLAGRDWVGLFTPGHTNDHLCLFDPTEGVLLSGDHVLPTITPHISGLVEGDSLARYVESLDRVAALEGVRTVLPAHGHPFFDLPTRVEAIKEHHDDRLDRLREISAGLGWATVEDLSHELFAPRSWGSMAESETYAHLEHLRLRNEADVRDDGGLLRYLVP
jgi:glyoxylase-like metal-dependent hydrolase (beta-lactamase superfamily II)